MEVESPKKLNIAQEGRANVALPAGVFYNPVQQFNRDITIAVIRHYEEQLRLKWATRNSELFKKYRDQGARFYHGIRVLEALGATGLRSIRFALEIPFVDKIYTNDIDPVAVNLIAKNVEENGISHITPTCSDAVDLMHKHKEHQSRFHVVDLDPYGTASPFLDGAVQCIHDDGLLCVTCTDMAVLCGSSPGTSMGKYGGMAVKCSGVHEQGLRLLLHAIQAAASRHGRVIEPLLSLSIDFYARVFVRVRTSVGSVKAIGSRIGLLITCPNCFTYNLQPMGVSTPHSKGNNVLISAARGPVLGPICQECGSENIIGGPMWCGPLHSTEFLDGLLARLHSDDKQKLSKTDTPCVAEKNYTDSTHSVSLEGLRMPNHLTGVENRNSSSTLNSDDLSKNNSKSTINNVIYEDMSNQPLCLPAAPDQCWPQEDLLSLGTRDRIIGMLSMAREELPDVPLYYVCDQLAGVIGCTMPKSSVIRSAFLNAGYRITLSHAARHSLKTDAPAHFVWDLFRLFRSKDEHDGLIKPLPKDIDWSKENDNHQRDCTTNISKRRKITQMPNSPNEKEHFVEKKESIIKQPNDKKSRPPLFLLRLVNKTVTTKNIDLTIHPEAEPPSKVKGLLRFQMNPQPYWGPKSRARTKDNDESNDEKSA